MPVHGQIRQAPGHLFEGENDFVAERTVFLIEPAEKRFQRAGRADSAQRPGNAESDIMREIGIRERLPQSFDRNLAIADQRLTRPPLGFGQNPIA